MGNLTEASLIEAVEKINEVLADQEKTLSLKPRYLIIHPMLYRKAMRLIPRRRYKAKKKWQITN